MTFREILALWPTMDRLAHDITQGGFVTLPGTVRAWKYYNSIPVRYWDRVVASARKYDIPVTLATLNEAAMAKRKESARWH